jgi:hypothetical protein
MADGGLLMLMADGGWRIADVDGGWRMADDLLDVLLLAGVRVGILVHQVDPKEDIVLGVMLMGYVRLEISLDSTGAGHLKRISRDLPRWDPNAGQGGICRGRVEGGICRASAGHYTHRADEAQVVHGLSDSNPLCTILTILTEQMKHRLRMASRIATPSALYLLYSQSR